MAERLRFELRKELPLCRFSRPVHSTALPSLRWLGFMRFIESFQLKRHKEKNILFSDIIIYTNICINFYCFNQFKIYK